MTRIDSNDLVEAMREQVSEATYHRGQLGYPAQAMDALIDAFGTVADWFEDTYLPGIGATVPDGEQP